MGKIVFIGHSVVKGTDYGGVTLADTFASKIGAANGYAANEIINKGLSNDTSAGVLARMQADVVANSASVCVVMIGVNDWGQSVPLQTFKANLLGIVSACNDAGIKCVMFTDNMHRGTTDVFVSYYPYIEAIKEVAHSSKSPLVDVYGAMSQKVLENNYLSLYVDNIHLSISGHSFIASQADKPFYSGVFVADQQTGGADSSALSVAMADVILSIIHPSLTASVKVERDKFQ